MAPLKKSTVSKVTPVKSRAIITKAENKKIYPYYSNHEKAKYFSIDSFVKEEFAGDLSEEDCYCFEKILGKDLKDRVVFDFQICQTAHTCGFLEVGDLDVICKEENISHLKEMLDALPRWSK